MGRLRSRVRVHVCARRAPRRRAMRAPRASSQPLPGPFSVRPRRSPCALHPYSPGFLFPAPPVTLPDAQSPFLSHCPAPSPPSRHIARRPVSLPVTMPGASPPAILLRVTALRRLLRRPSGTRGLGAPRLLAPRPRRRRRRQSRLRPLPLPLRRWRLRSLPRLRLLLPLAFLRVWIVHSSVRPRAAANPLEFPRGACRACRRVRRLRLGAWQSRKSRTPPGASGCVPRRVRTSQRLPEPPSKGPLAGSGRPRWCIQETARWAETGPQATARARAALGRPALRRDPCVRAPARPRVRRRRARPPGPRAAVRAARRGHARDRAASCRWRQG